MRKKNTVGLPVYLKVVLATSKPIDRFPCRVLTGRKCNCGIRCGSGAKPRQPDFLPSKAASAQSADWMDLESSSWGPPENDPCFARLELRSLGHGDRSDFCPPSRVLVERVSVGVGTLGFSGVSLAQANMDEDAAEKGCQSRPGPRTLQPRRGVPRLSLKTPRPT